MNSDYRQVQHYLAHFGIKGQSWYTRHFQSYETAPTRSGKVGQEVGEAARENTPKKRISSTSGGYVSKAKRAYEQSKQNARDIQVKNVQKTDSQYNDYIKELDDVIRQFDSGKDYVESDNVTYSNKNQAKAIQILMKEHKLNNLHKSSDVDPSILSMSRKYMNDLQKEYSVYYIASQDSHVIFPKDSGNDTSEILRYLQYYKSM